ncbi:AraC family transcriptional regulator, partial [Paenibacillus sp. 28ISP30-2]|nr:AraC family transcriptional regulator [Paenibacillus sp. 28ISP30-2]
CFVFFVSKRRRHKGFRNGTGVQTGGLPILMLGQSDRKGVDIALEVGFDNLSYFIATFKKWNGMTPSQFRKQHEAEQMLAAAPFVTDMS